MKTIHLESKIYTEHRSTEPLGKAPKVINDLRY